MALGGGAEYRPPGPSVKPGVGPQRGQPASTPGRPGQGNRGRGPGKPPPKGPPNRGPSKPPTRPAAAAQVLGAPKAKSPYYGGEVLNPGGLTRDQLQKIGGPLHFQELGEQATARAPYQQNNAEILNTQKNVEGRLGQINEGNKTYLQGLLEGAEGSAKTANNYAAENALSAQKAVETAGQNAQTNVAGQYAGNVAATEQRGQANVQAIRTMALAAAAQGQQGLEAARSRFGTESAKNKAGERAALEKVSGRVAKERMEIPLKVQAASLAKQAAERKGLIEEGKLKDLNTATNVKVGQLGLNARSVANRRQGEVEKYEIGRRNARTNFERLGVTERGQTLAAQGRKESVQQRERSREARERGVAATIKGRLEVAEKKAAAAGQKPLTPSVRRQYENELGAAYSAMENGGREAAEKHQKAPNYGAIRAGLSAGYGSAKEGKGKYIKGGKASNPVILQAAEDIWRYGKLQNSTSAAMERIGLPGSSAGWSNLLRR